MERRKSSYSIHKRPTAKHRHVYYVRFRGEDGAYRSAVSSGCSRRDDAVRWAESHLAQEKDLRENITLAEYTQGFWNPEGAFALDRSAHGRPVSRTYLDIAEGYTCNHLLPSWGGRRLRDLEARTLDTWIVDLHREGKLAPATINKLLQTLRTILEQAVLDGLLTHNPARHARSVRVRRPERSILTLAEAVRLLAGPEPWGDYRHYAINVLAASTGIRMGEVRTLIVENVQRDHVQIRRSWEEGYGPRPPKADSMRDVPLSPKVHAVLERVIQETEPHSLLFYGRAGEWSCPDLVDMSTLRKEKQTCHVA